MELLADVHLSGGVDAASLENMLAES